jgi:hypothetical protein
LKSSAVAWARGNTVVEPETLTFWAANAPEVKIDPIIRVINSALVNFFIISPGERKKG